MKTQLKIFKKKEEIVDFQISFLKIPPKKKRKIKDFQISFLEI